MKKSGFTLIELMIVIVVICILAATTFRLVGASGEQDKIARTTAKLEKIALALECFKSIYGKYPPVQWYGKSTSNVYGKDIKSFKDEGQPVVFAFPSVPSGAKLAGNTVGPEEAARIAEIDKLDKLSWGDNTLFTFGLLSFFMPRYTIAAKAGCPTELMGVPSDSDSPPENWSAAGHRVDQWEQHNRRRSDSAIGDSTRDINAARKILPYLDVDFDAFMASGGQNGNGIITLHSDDFMEQSMQQIITPGGRFLVPIKCFRIEDDFGSSKDENVESNHAIRYLSRPPYESYEIRSAGPDNTFYTDDDIVIGSK